MVPLTIPKIHATTGCSVANVRVEDGEGEAAFSLASAIGVTSPPILLLHLERRGGGIQTCGRPPRHPRIFCGLSDMLLHFGQTPGVKIEGKRGIKVFAGPNWCSIMPD